jgi:hypothetical protein
MKNTTKSALTEAKYRLIPIPNSSRECAGVLRKSYKGSCAFVIILIFPNVLFIRLIKSHATVVLQLPDAPTIKILNGISIL